MPADRSVYVRLRADVASYNRDIASSAAVTGLLGNKIDGANSSLAMFDKTAGGSTRQLDRFSGRLGLILDTAAALGPSLIPIATIGIPAVTGLATSLGFVATGLGAVMASTQGIGDALTALNKYALEPTDEHLEDVQQTLLKLAPDAQGFVLQLRRLGPELKQVRDAGAGELFPHWSDSLESLETLLPTIEELVSRVARKAGEISEQGAESLAGPRWTEFFSFLQDETPLALGKLAKAVGNLAHAGSELWMAFDPLNDDFLNVLLRGTEQIDQWATGLEQTEGFQEFLDYIETNGPQVGETLGAMAMALLNIVEAAAPIGAASLPILEALADVISVIADSDLGTPVLGVLALSRALAMLERARPTGLIADFNAIRNNDPWTTARIGGIKAATKETERYNAAVARTRATLLKVGGVGGAVAGLMAVQSGLTDKIGLTNTALGASLGLMAGPWGAAVGAGIGLVMDFAAAQDLAVVAAEDLVDAINLQTGALEAQGYAKIGEAFADLADEAATVGISLSDVIAAAVEGGPALHEMSIRLQEVIDAGTSIDEATQTEVMDDAALAAWALTEALGGQNAEVKEAIELAQGRKAGLDAAAEGERKVGDAAEHAVSPAREVAQAIADMGDESLDASQKADALAASLDELLGPELELSAATDAWRAGLRDLKGELSENGNRLKGFTKDATENRAVIRDRVSDLTDMLVKEAAAGGSAEELAKKIRNNRKALLDQGEAAGLSRKALGEYLNTLGLTPKAVETIIRIAKDLEAKQKAKDVQAAIEKIPPNRNTALKVDNAQALAGARAVQAELARVDRFVESVIRIRTEHMSVRLGEPKAGGGLITGPGTATSDSILTPTSNNEYVMRAAAVQKYGVAMFDSLNSGRTVLGRPSGPGLSLPGGPPKVPGDNAGGFGSDASGMLGEIIKAMLTSGFGPGQIRAFQKDLDELQRALSKNKGKWTKDLRQDARDLLKEIRETEKERGRTIREAFKALETDLAAGAAAIRTELRDLKRDLRDAGGVWNAALRKHAERIVALARQYDRQAAKLAQQEEVLGSLIATGEQLRSAQESFVDQVRGNFTNDPFGKGLEGFFLQTSADTNDATAFAAVLRQLIAMGLDGPALQALFASGDLATAQQLLATGMIDAFEAAFGGREAALGRLGGFAGNEVFGQALRDNGAQVAAQSLLITATNSTMDKLQGTADRLEKRLKDLAGLPAEVKDGAEKGTYRGAKDALDGRDGRVAAGRR